MNNSIYKYHDKQMTGSVDRMLSHPIYTNNQNLVDTRMIQTNQESSSMKTNPSRIIPINDMSVEDKINMDMINQKRRQQNKTQNNETCKAFNSDGICYTNYEKNIEKGKTIPMNIVNCILNGKYYSNIGLFYSTTEEVFINCDYCKNRTVDGYHHIKTDLCGSCYKTLAYNMRDAETKQKQNDVNPRNNLNDAFIDFGSITGPAQGYSSVGSSWQSYGNDDITKFKK